MATESAVRFRVDPHTLQRLDRLRTEKAINVSAWLRRLVQQGLDQEFPDLDEAPAEPDPPKPTIEPDDAQEPDPHKPAIEGWKPRKLSDSEWGAVLEGPRVAGLPDNDQLPGTRISVTDRRGESWDSTLTEVDERTDSTLVVRTSGRPRD